MGNVFDEALERGSLGSEADKTRIGSASRSRSRGGAPCSYLFIELRATKEVGPLVNACTGVRSSGALWRREDRGQYHRRDGGLPQAGRALSFLARGCPWRPLYGTIDRSEGRCEGRPSRPRRAPVDAVRQPVGGVEINGALMCPVVQSTPPRTHNKAVNLGNAEPGIHPHLGTCGGALRNRLGLQMYFGSLMGARVLRGIDRGNYVLKVPSSSGTFSPLGSMKTVERSTSPTSIPTVGRWPRWVSPEPQESVPGFTLSGRRGSFEGCHARIPLPVGPAQQAQTQVSCSDEEWAASYPVS